MNISRVLLSLPLRRQTVVGALLMATVLFIVYQFTFIAELGESANTPHKRHQDARAGHPPNEKPSSRKYQKDVKLQAAGDLPVKNVDVGAESRNSVDGDGKLLMNMAPKDTASQNVIKNGKAMEAQHRLTVTFKCEKSGKEITVDKLNDNYCDCPEDGSDEPRTNACTNGRFMCLKYVKPFPESVPSGWVNDGVCDCCDGSDEWNMKKSDANLPLSLQRKIGRYLSPCPDQCPDAL